MRVEYYTEDHELRDISGLADLFTVCKYWHAYLSQIFTRQTRSSFECKVCHVGNKDLRCQCIHSICYQQYDVFGRCYSRWQYTRNNDSKTGEVRHRWNPSICLAETKHYQDCTLGKQILSLDGVCIPCLRDAKQLCCGKCNIKFMSTYKGWKPLCPRCLDGDTTKEIALPCNPPFSI